MQPFAYSFWRNLHFKGIFLHVNSLREASCAFFMNHLGENRFLCDYTVHSYFAYFHRGVKSKCKFQCLFWDFLSTWSRIKHKIALKRLQPASKCLQMHFVISCIAYEEQKPSRFVHLIASIAPSPPHTRRWQTRCIFCRLVRFNCESISPRLVPFHGSRREPKINFNETFLLFNLTAAEKNYSPFRHRARRRRSMGERES